MGCGLSSNEVVPRDTDQQTLLVIKQNKELKEEIENYKLLANQRQIELEKFKRESAHNENNLNIINNNQIRSVKQIKNVSNSYNNINHSQKYTNSN